MAMEGYPKGMIDVETLVLVTGLSKNTIWSKIKARNIPEYRFKGYGKTHFVRIQDIKDILEEEPHVIQLAKSKLEPILAMKKILEHSLDIQASFMETHQHEPDSKEYIMAWSRHSAAEYYLMCVKKILATVDVLDYQEQVSLTTVNPNDIEEDLKTLLGDTFAKRWI
ncbi:hypothetical protein ACFYKX_10800 [Cytobacillus sp. FJAT-54145]|uniref:Helix-turn-helix domain-containing protein n=1 Tax=Cytobacillus spartinae TaxID=3299023 RepID=A0ABW6KA35_9BACI